MLMELRAGLFLLVAASPLMLPGSAAAIQRATPQAIRVTSGASHQHSTGRSWGRYLAYASPIDLTGGGAAGSQAYVFSLEQYTCQFGRPELQLPTEEPLVCPRPAKPYVIRATDGTTADNIANPSVSSSGSIVAFEAFGSYKGKCAAVPGAAGRRQVFIENLATKETVAITCNPDGDSYYPSLNDAGGALVFLSTSGFTGAPVGVPQVYIYQYTNPDPRRVGQITPVTYGRFAVGRAPSGSPMLNKLGTHIVFESRANLLGDGGDSGHWNIFWFDRALERLFQITNGNGDSRNPYVEEKRPGSFFFDSTATDIQGTQSAGGRQIFRAEVKDTSGDFPLAEQFTFGPGNSWFPAVEPNGGKVAFISDGDHLENGTTGPRIFVQDFRDPAARVLYQVTGRGRIGQRLGASLGAWFLSFDSDDDVGGYGICGRQIWITTYDPTHYTEAGHVRIPATELGRKPGEPFPGNPNAGCADGDGCTADTCLGGQVCVHAQQPEGFVCFGGDPCTTGTGTCQAGDCVIQPPLDCDDRNKCTDDTCEADTGCGHTAVDCDDDNPCTVDTCEATTGCANTPLPAMDGIRCQAGQVGPPGNASPKVLRNLRRAQKLVEQAKNKGRKAQARKLKQASQLFESATSDIGNDPSLPREVKSDLVEKLYGLLAQIADLLADLRSSKGNK